MISAGQYLTLWIFVFVTCRRFEFSQDQPIGFGFIVSNMCGVSTSTDLTSVSKMIYIVHVWPGLCVICASSCATSCKPCNAQTVFSPFLSVHECSAVFRCHSVQYLENIMTWMTFRFILEQRHYVRQHSPLWRFRFGVALSSCLNYCYFRSWVPHRSMVDYSRFDHIDTSDSETWSQWARIFSGV